MNRLMPEPASDILAQVNALLDPRHPKTAVFVAPGNEGEALQRVADLCILRRWGTVISADTSLAYRLTSTRPSECEMAEILGYPEPKDAAIAACPASWLRVVQAYDWRGNVITEAMCSPAWLVRTKIALAPHGNIRILTVDEALNRRFAMRCAEAA